MDNSYLDIEDAKRELKLPILGAISRITTHEAIEVEKNRRRMLIVTGLASGVFVIVITMSFFLLKK